MTINSLVRNAKVLFSKKLLLFLDKELNLPSPLPFEGVIDEKVGSLRYHSSIEPKALLRRAHTELPLISAPAYSIFLLALMCVLRVSEIDNLLWSQVDLANGTIHICSTEYHTLKSTDSEGIIELTEGMISHLLNLKKLNEGNFVVATPANMASWKSSKYRCQKSLTILIQWLRENGITAQKPIHTLRKEIGSITTAFYLDKKKSIKPSLGF